MPMTLAELLALLPDNTTGAIGADDMRTVTTELFNQPYTPPVVSVDGETGAVNLTDNYTRLLHVTAVQAGNYTAAPNEFVLFDTAAAARTLTLPTAPPAGTQVGARIVTFGAGNFVNVNAAGTDVFDKPGGPATNASTLQYNNNSIVYVYDSGVWTRLSSYYPLSSLDTRYVNETDVVTLAAGQDLQLNAPVGGVQTVQVTDTQHALWTPTFIRASADDAVTNINTVHDDPTLQFPFVANAVYDITLRVIYTGDPTITTGGQVRTNCRISSGAGATFDYVNVAAHNSWPGTGATIYGGYYALTASSGDQTYGQASPNTVPTMLIATGTLISSTVAGTLIWQWGQKVAVATPTTRKTGSVLIARRLV